MAPAVNGVLRPHVLVVDDEESLRRLVDEYLVENDFRVTAVVNGAGLLSTLGSEVIDLVLLDL
ncbi:MAG TPA: response regulator, partial [Steroidobacteraceae bacterium]